MSDWGEEINEIYLRPLWVAIDIIEFLEKIQERFGKKTAEMMFLIASWIVEMGIELILQFDKVEYWIMIHGGAKAKFYVKTFYGVCIMITMFLATIIRNTKSTADRLIMRLVMLFINLYQDIITMIC